MATKLALSSVVVAAQHFNPSVTGQNWLVEHGIVLAEEFQAGSVFTDMFVQIPTRDFHLQVIPENCQLSFSPNTDNGRQQELIKERLGVLISLLPHTPYTGVGLNFVWQFFPDNETVGAACRRLFFSEEKPLYQGFDKADARFGAYLSMPWRSYRLSLDAKPVSIALANGEPSQMIQFAFNYHRGVVGRPQPTLDIINALGEWDSAMEDSRSILRNATGEIA